jgi:hypothetical protein
MMVGGLTIFVTKDGEEKKLNDAAVIEGGSARQQ